MRRRSSRNGVLPLPLAALLLLGACTRPPTRNETRARDDLKTTEAVYRPAEDLRTVTSVYRPRSARPPLPTLTPTSGLSDLMGYALLNSPKVESAFYEWKGAVEAITTARSLPDPMLSLSAEISKGLMAFTPTLMTDPAMSWPGPGKLGLRADAAYEEALKRRAAFENEMLAAALAVKRAYYQSWVVEEQIRWTREALAVVDEMEKLARERLIVGKVTQQDVLRAQMERDRLKTQLANLEDSREPIQARLRSALGVGPEQAMPAFAARLEPTPPDFTERALLEIGFTRNPRLKGMRSEVMQAFALYQLARKATVPDFSFGLGADLKSSPVSWMPSVGVTLPIWRDKIAAEIAQSGAAVGAAKARLSAEELELAVRFAETAFAWREADRNAKLYGERLLPKARAALDSARAGYTGGVSSFLDLLDAQRNLLDYSLNHATATGEREMVLAEMSLVILGRWPEGVKGILAPEPPPDIQPEKQPPSSGGQ